MGGAIAPDDQAMATLLAPAGGRRMKRLFLLMVVAGLLCLATVSAYGEFCLQETANTTTGCGLSTGRYAVEKDTTSGRILINYTKMWNVTNASVWQVKIGELPSTNYTFPQECWNYSSDHVRLKLESTNTESSAQCYNGSAWHKIINYSGTKSEISGANYVNASLIFDEGYETYAQFFYYYVNPVTIGPYWIKNSVVPRPANRLYEEAVFWDMDYPNLAVQVNDTINAALVTGLCVNVNSEDKCNTTGTTVTFVDLPPAIYNISVTSLGVGDGTTFEYPSIIYEHSLINSSNLTINATPFALNLSFYDYESFALIDHVTIDLSVQNDLYGGNFSTANGYLLANTVLGGGETTLRYEAPGFAQNFFIFDIAEATTDYYYNLTLLNTTGATEISMYVYDDLGNTLEGAIIKVLRYDPATNDYNLVATAKTNFEGQTKTYVTLNDEYYRFMIYYDDVLRQTTNPTYVYGTSLTFRISITDGVLTGFYQQGQVTGRVSVNSAKTTAAFIADDIDSEATQICLYGYKPANGGLTLLNSSCLSASTGQVFLPVNNATSTEWFLKGVVTKNGTAYTIDTERVDYPFSLPDTDWTTAFYALLITIIIMFTGAWNLEVALILVGIVPLVFTIAGLWTVGYAITIPLFISSIVIVIILVAKK